MRLPHRRRQDPSGDPSAKPYPHDPEHTDRPYEQVQRDVGTSLALGAVVLVVLVLLLAIGLW